MSIEECSSTEPQICAPADGKVKSVELAVFLFLIVPSMVLSLFAIRQGTLGFPLTATAIICRDLALVSLILYFLWRNGEPVRRIGWTWRHVQREMFLGLLCFVPAFLGAAILERVCLWLGLTTPSAAPSFLDVQGQGEALLAFVLVTVVAVAEETIFRGYLLLRLPVVVRGMGRAVALSSTIFALGHGYEGSAGLVTVGCLGAAFALVYLWRGSLVAPIVMHFLQDFIGVVLLPLLGAK